MTNQNSGIQVLRTASNSSEENYLSRKAAKERHQFLATYVTELITLQHRVKGQFFKVISKKVNFQLCYSDYRSQ